MSEAVKCSTTVLPCYFRLAASFSREKCLCTVLISCCRCQESPVLESKEALYGKPRLCFPPPSGALIKEAILRVYFYFAGSNEPFSLSLSAQLLSSDGGSQVEVLFGGRVLAVTSTGNGSLEELLVQMHGGLWKLCLDLTGEQSKHQ